MPAVWSYLAATYDKDGDGRIVAQEYSRSAQTFARLDRDHDEALTAADFEGPARMDEVIAHLVLMRHLRDPAGTGPPGSEEVAARFARLDRDKDGRLERRELEAVLAASRPLPEGGPPEVPKGVHVYDSLLILLDRDASRDLALSEIEEFRARAAEKARAAQRAEGAEGSPARPRAPAVGDPAPDFTLATHDGGALATLSDYRGSKPVALIFGSWT